MFQICHRLLNNITLYTHIPSSDIETIAVHFLGHIYAVAVARGMYVYYGRAVS